MTTHLASEAIVAELKTKVRQHGLVVWLDADAQYTPLADALAGGAFGFGYPVVPFRGSYLELMLALEGYGNDRHAEHLLVHLPGVNKDTVRETPVYELAAAGKMHERNLATAIREAAVGVARPEEVDAFVRAPDLSLARADAWLAERAGAPRDDVAQMLENVGLEEVVLLVLAGDRKIASHLPAHGESLLSFLEKGLGLDAAWRAFRIGDAELRPEIVASLVASFLMAVEFVHDLRDAPITPELRALSKLGPLAKVSRKLAARFRERLPDLYEELETDLQRVLVEERTSHHAEALGSIDTFRFEEAATRAAALDALRDAQWERAHAFAVDRTPEACFWVKRSPSLQRTWELIRLAAEAGRAFDAQARGLDRCTTLEEATARYADKLAPVDRAHRVFEQRAHALLASDLDDHDALLDARKAVREAHRAWTDGINRAFFELCRARGPLPGRSLRQRTVYEEVVQRAVDEGARVAYFMIDALRFEMAQELGKQLERDKFRVRLSPRLAELPTETHVGMNALAPVEDDGTLRAIVRDGDLVGFRRKEFAVCDPPARVRAIVERSMRGQQALDLELEAFADKSLIALQRQLSRTGPVIVVRSRELDTAGENRLHLGTFDQTLALVKSAISLLSQAGVTRFVVAADHGFLLQDSTARNAQFGASKRSATRRYGIRKTPSGMADALEVRLSALEYETADDLHLVFAPDTRVWKTEEEVAPFVHGGNSLQERVIPVLEVERTAARGKTLSKYEVVARPLPAHLGRQRLSVSVRLQQRESATLSFAGPTTIGLALRVRGRDDLTLTVISADPPAELASGQVQVPPNRAEALIEFEIEGAIDEKVQVEVYHPDAVAEVTPKVVDGFFDVARDRRLPRSETPKPPPVEPPKAGGWQELIADEAYRRALTILAERRSINEEELCTVLGSSTRVRIFSRRYEELLQFLPFQIEVLTVNGMKVYTRKD